LRSKVGEDALDGDGGIDGAKLLAGSHGFGKGVASVGLVEKGLALKVGGFDKVAVEDAETADAGAREQRDSRGTDGTATDDYGARSGEALLPGLADARKRTWRE